EPSRRGADKSAETVSGAGGSELRRSTGAEGSGQLPRVAPEGSTRIVYVCQARPACSDLLQPVKSTAGSAWEKSVAHSYNLVVVLQTPRAQAPVRCTRARHRWTDR